MDYVARKFKNYGMYVFARFSFLNVLCDICAVVE